MATEPSGTRIRILNSAYALFYREGFARVSVDAIAEAAKVTKKTVYYHFKSKDDIVAEVLHNQHQFMMQQFVSWAGPASNGPAAMVDSLFERLKTWADSPHWVGSGFTRIAMELADMPGHPARRAASSHKGNIEHWLADQFVAARLSEPEDLARQIMILIEGSMSLSLIHSDTSRFRCAAHAARTLLDAAQRDR